MSANPVSRITPEQYLELDRAAEFKSEYVNGEIFAMSGAKDAHVTISLNIGAELRSVLRGRGCQPGLSDRRIGVTSRGPFFYPDVSVYCGEPVLGDQYQDTILNPTLIIEVLSASTEAYDRGKKFAAYRSIEPLREYALVSQIEPIIEVFFKEPGDKWSLTAFNGLETTCKFSSLNIEIPLAEIYRDVKLES